VYRRQWELLARSKPGDRLRIRTRHGTETITFHYVLERGEKYVLLAEEAEGGRLLRYALAALVVLE
jgi:DNA repair ATPase RecN